MQRTERRASAENPSTSLANPAAWLTAALGGGPTDAGVTVNHRTALKLSAVFACTNVLSQDVAKLPFITYRRVDRGGKERARDHPVFRLLHDEANPQMSAYNLRRTLQAHVTLWGKAFAEIQRNGAGDPVALWPLLPDRTEVERVGGEKRIVTRVGGEKHVLSDDDVLHVPGLGFDGLRGYSVVGFARESIGGAMAAEQFGSRFFGNGARPGGVIMLDRSLSEQAQQRVRDSWERMHQGLSNAQRVAILDEGMKYESIGVPPEDAQFIATKQHGVEDVIRFFRMPPHKVQHLIHAGVRANVEAENISYVTDTLQSWLVNWEQEVNRTLFRDEERDTFFAEHQVQGLLRGDSEARAEFYQRGINNGWFSVNDVRGFENLNPIEGGDRHFVPLNLIPLDGADALASPDDVGDDGDDEDRASRARERERRSVAQRHRIQEAHRRGFREVGARVVRQEVEAVREIAEKTLGRRQSADFLADVDRFYESFEDTVRRRFEPLLAGLAGLVKGVIGNELGRDTEPNPRYDRFVRDYAGGFARRHVRKGQQQLRAVVQDVGEEEAPEAVEVRLGEWEEERADKIAMTEGTRAVGAFSKAAYLVAGVFTLVWRTVGENCPYCERLNGKVVSIQENFVNAGDFIDPEGDEATEPMRVRQNIGHPPAHRACDCQVGPGGF